MVLNVHRNRKAYYGRGEGRKGAWGWEERGIIYLSLHCHDQNDSFIKIGSDESHFNVSLIVRDKVTRQCPQTTTFEEKGELKRIRTEVPPLTSPMPYRSAKPAHSPVLARIARYMPILTNRAQLSHATNLPILTANPGGLGREKGREG